MAAGDPGSGDALAGGARAGDGRAGRGAAGDANAGAGAEDAGARGFGASDRSGQDFGALYRELGFDGSGGIDALKARYRRRVAQWHPDREGTTPAQAERLKLLNRRYAAAVAFYRRCGHLPGVDVASASPRIDFRAAAPAPPSPAAFRAPARHHVWLAAGALVILACVAWWQWAGMAGDAVDAEADAKARNDHANRIPATSRASERRMHGSPTNASDPVLLERGLPRGAVLALLGPPAIRHEDDALWSYGPSWIVFECGRVAGWYSSPLAGLRARGVRPGERVGLAPGEASKACAPELPTLAGEAAR